MAKLYMMHLNDYIAYMAFDSEATAQIWIDAERRASKHIDGWDDETVWELLNLSTKLHERIVKRCTELHEFSAKHYAKCVDRLIELKEFEVLESYCVYALEADGFNDYDYVFSEKVEDEHMK